MRVFEMRFEAQGIHSKAEADEFLRGLQAHHGHIGEIFAQFCVKNRAAVEQRVQAVVREIDHAAKITTAERFWSARVAAGVVACEIANALGLLPYDAAMIKEWSVTRQIPYMRGIVQDEYRDPLAVLTDYIAERSSNILVVDKATTIGGNTSGKAVAADTAYPLNRPSGALEGHYDLKAGVLLLRKQGFKEYCQNIGANMTQILSELGEPRSRGMEPPRRIITNKNVRRTPGAGTEYAKGQVWCFVVDMRHPEISDQPVLTTVSSGPSPTTTAMVGNDR